MKIKKTNEDFYAKRIDENLVNSSGREVILNEISAFIT